MNSSRAEEAGMNFARSILRMQPRKIRVEDLDRLAWEPLRAYQNLRPWHSPLKSPEKYPIPSSQVTGGTSYAWSEKYQSLLLRRWSRHSNEKWRVTSGCK